MVRLTIDGISLEVAAGTTVLAAAEKAGVDIPHLCSHEKLAPYGACGLCVVEVAGCPKLLRACATQVAEGMVVDTRGERALHARKIALELLMGDHDADCRGPCMLACPAHTNCQKYVGEIASGRFAEAVATVKETFPLPASIGRVCPHPCEAKCRRALADEAVSIAHLKAFAGDWVLAHPDQAKPETKAAPSGRTVGIVGGGPAGLSAAARLARLGHAVTLFDQMPEMGGMLRYGIPEYRLPKRVLAAEVRQIAALGVTFVNDFKVGRTETLEALRGRFDALLVANGAWRSTPLGTTGENLKGVWGGLDFLRERPALTGRRVIVVGGGNTAMDACRTAVRLGAAEVSVVYRRTRAEMPAEKIEIAEAEEEGVSFRFLRAPAEICGEGGAVTSVRLQVMELGEPDERGRRRPVPVADAFETVAADCVIAAIGQRNDPAGFEALPVSSRGTIMADEANFATSLPGVFACGDAVNRGAGIAIEAIAQANAAALGIDAYLRGGCYRPVEPVLSRRSVTAADYADVPKAPRVAMPTRAAAVRAQGFEEVNLGLDEASALREAKRCLSCGCHAFDDCRLIRAANRLRTDVSRLTGAFHPGFEETKLVSIARNSRKCIGCNLCVRICEEHAKKGLLGLVGRGFSTVIRPEFDTPEAVSGCASCHLCVDACPTGALALRP